MIFFFGVIGIRIIKFRIKKVLGLFVQLCKHATHGLNKAFSLTLSPLWKV